MLMWTLGAVALWLWIYVAARLVVLAIVRTLKEERTR